MDINLEKLNRLAYANEQRLRDAKHDAAKIQSCYDVRGTLAKIAKEAKLVRCFDMSFRKLFAI